MLELADRLAWGASGSYAVWVQVPSLAPPVIAKCPCALREGILQLPRWQFSAPVWRRKLLIARRFFCFADSRPRFRTQSVRNHKNARCWYLVKTFFSHKRQIKFVMISHIIIKRHCVSCNGVFKLFVFYAIQKESPAFTGEPLLFNWWR